MEKNNYVSAKILRNEKIDEGIFIMELEGNFQGVPGQFYMLRAWDEYPLLPRPISIFDLDDEKITFLYAVVGKGTGIMADLKEGASMQILGPLGNGFPLEDNKKIALVAGGIGLAPMKYLARKLNGKVDLFAGFRNSSYLMDEMKEFVDNVIVTTNDGNEGKKGFITDYIKDEYDVVYACGPNPMMNSLKNLSLNAKSYYSLEAHMACGIGACLGCAIETTKGIKRVCHEGPVFNGEEVIFDVES
ncbi:dihydroorotate dehydrogenase electron transfer subunit [Miniphocaeibacter massiliensis]|uniref:dihydroorotate dehydrogenase electron transfer subunit n=1 Tax=Miniphocaeibacter massiliensis TaxID=2041841 RepID=UPI000C073677|nr:dihydroorotate dehydrogenase electron transfer subunit [Miniphocaeibacter massiliensis]